MAAGGHSLPGVDVVVQPCPRAARGLLGLNGGGKCLWESACGCWAWFLNHVAGCWHCLLTMVVVAALERWRAVMEVHR